VTRLRLFAIPFSTNVERVALALGHKRLEAELVLCDPADRAPIVAVSGQPLVPVLDDGGTIVTDSSGIIEYLERQYPQRPLFPADPSHQVRMRIFIDWFDRVWKHPPNAIEQELVAARPDAARIDSLSAEMQQWLGWFEQLLEPGPYLFGEQFSAADCAAYPFLTYARGAAPDDDELFHQVLADHLTPHGPRLDEWLSRVDEHPRAFGYGRISSS
jgi:maleylpyruvate isomerase